MLRNFVISLLAVVILLGASQAEGQFFKRLRDRAAAQGQDRQLETTADIRNIAGVTVATWVPQETPAPLVIFSHGFGGCKTQSTFLMEALVAAGYVVVAPDHKDALCGGNGVSGIHKPEQKFRDYDSWTDATYKDRAADIRKVYKAMLEDNGWARHIDFSRVAVVGHSLGGYTALGLAGAWPSWKMPEVKAVLALSPYVGPYLKSGSLANLGVPVMYQSGKLDLGIRTAVAKENGAYDQSAAPAVYVEFDKVGHFAWTDLRPDAHAAIVKYSVWFLDHALKDDRKKLGKDRGVSDLRVK